MCRLMISGSAFVLTNASCWFYHDAYHLCIAGLQRRFRHLVPHQYYINCRNHRLALCVKHLIKHFPILAEVDSALLAIWKLFDNSQQRFAVFKEVQSSYGMKELVLVRAAATRWLSHGRACKRLIDRYVQVTLNYGLVYTCASGKRDIQVDCLKEAANGLGF